MFRWHGPSVSKDPKATYAADVLSFILGQQTSKFHKNVVESGLSYGANFGYYTLNHTGPITLFAQTSVENFDACQKALFDELKRMTDPDYFTDEQLENACRGAHVHGRLSAASGRESTRPVPIKDQADQQHKYRKTILPHHHLPM